MRNGKVHFVLFVIALAVIATVVSFSPGNSRGQAPAHSKTSVANTATPVVNDGSSRTSSKSSAFATAATANVTLRKELSWTFGGKQQHGWYLYDLLVGKTLNSEHDSTTADFAGALASWQKHMGLNADGVLNQDSLMRMISVWQSNRLKNRAYAEPGDLMTAPPSDFYDPERVAELRQVEHKTYAAYKEMVAAAIADPALNLAHTTSGELAPREKYFKIVSAFRPREYQEQLRRQSPNAGSAGLAVNSPHFTGRALDLYVGGSPVDTNDSNRAIQVNTPAYRWLVHNAERFGFRPYFYEPWHWEYVK